MLSSNKFTAFFVIAAGLAAASVGRAQTQTLYIPQVADGGSWQTTLVITNATTTSQPLSMTFYSEIAGGTGGTQSWSLAFIEPVPTTVPAASTIFLHTLGAGVITDTGWGAISAGPGVIAYAIFSQGIGGIHEDATGLALPAASRFLIPFDQTLTSSVGLAIANTGTTTETVTVAVKTSAGAVTSAALTVPALGHFNFALSSPPAALSSVLGTNVAQTGGLLEIYTSSANLAALALRFNGTAAPSPFTATPVYAEAGSPIIGPPGGSTAAPFTELYVNGTWTLTSTASPVIINVVANAGTYKAAVIGTQQPYVLVSFPNGTLSGNTLTFGPPASNGLFGSTLSITGGSLSLTVINFNQVGSPVSGTMSINSATGSITGTSTYQP